MPVSRSCPRKLIATLWDGTRIMRVSGPCVRREHDPDFTEGCHGYLRDRCAKYIPKKEIWIEAMRNRQDERAILFHELFEWHSMKYHKMGYDRAHARASSVEQAIRKHSGKLRCRA